MIDAHVHLRDWGQSEKETLLHGMSVALHSGVDELFDMPNTSPPLTDRASIEKRISDAKRCGLPVRYHLYAGVTSEAKQIEQMVALSREYSREVIGLKMFAGHSTGQMGLIEGETQREVYRTLAALGYEGVIALHCEKESLLLPELEDASDYSSHSLARPVEAEAASVADQIKYSEEAGFKGHLHICHLSSVSSLILVEEARKKGRRISCAATPHHLLLNSENASDHFLYAKMNPPLRSEAEREALFSALLAGRIDWIETDHAPHTLADKEGGASGIPGFSGLLLLVKRLYEVGCPLPLMRSLLGERVQQVFGLEEREVFIPPFDGLDQSSLFSAKAYPFDSFSILR
ncbi:MAG TPA: dihydroorotase family protein [Spirochaetales bacterium]|jgi:dihydroorotase|nr:dihydroorotase family protein [Spirochaetales bacterium]